MKSGARHRVQRSIFETVETLRRQVLDWRRQRETVVLVPTMGALHEGHRALVSYAKTLGRRVMVSIFVNPTQFGPNEDFSRYPRDLATDLTSLGAVGADAVYTPTAEIMYPTGFSSRIELTDPSEGLCGEFRPGHFSGVATVVTKLINQAQPDVALFGEKDFQQLQVIRRVARDLDLPVEIAGMPTMREADGLALSSRNRYLRPAERSIAPRLHMVLTRIAEKAANGHDTTSLINHGISELESAGFGPVQYLELRDEETLASITQVDRPARILVAAYLGKTRLIDNVAVTPHP